MVVTTIAKSSKKYWKWTDKKTNKIQDYIDKISHKIVFRISEYLYGNSEH